MYKKSLVLLCGLLLASPLIALAEENRPVEQPKKYGRKQEARMNPYLERFLSLVASATLGTAGIILGKNWCSYLDTKFTASIEHWGKANQHFNEWYAETYPNARIATGDAILNDSFKEMHEPLMLKGNPHVDGYFAEKQLAECNRGNEGDGVPLMLSAILLGYAGYYLYRCFTIKNDTAKPEKPADSITEQNV